MSENEQQSQTNAVINDKLQGIVVTYLRCSGIFSNQINSGLLLSLPVKKFKMGEYFAYLRAKRSIVSCTVFDF